MNILVVVRLSKDESIDECVPFMWAKKLKKHYNAHVYCLAMDAREKRSYYEKCFDYGVERVYMLSDIAFAASDTYATSKILQAGIKRIAKDFDIVLTSYISKFGETSHVPVSLAAWNDLSFALNVTDIVPQEKGIICTEELGECRQSVEMEFPILVSVSNAQSQTFFIENQLNLFDLMQAKEKDFKFFTMKDLQLDESRCGQQGSYTDVVNSKQLSTSREHIVLEDDVEQLWMTLNNEISVASRL